MKTLIALALACLHSTLLMACSGGAEGAGSPGGFPLDGERFAETCNGTFECSPDAGESFTITMFMGPDACLFDDVAEPGGYPAVLEPTSPGIVSAPIMWDGESGSWTPSQAGFDVCLDSGGCFRCKKTSSPAPSSGQHGSCKGAAAACSSVSAGSCWTQKGCMMTSQVKANGSLAYHCTGIPVMCETIYDEHSCSAQNGCVWE